MKNSRCFFQIRGRWHVLMNWQARSQPNDIAVMNPLSSKEVATLLSLQKEGYKDTSIFDRLFPPGPALPEKQKVSLPVSLLSKAQLAYVIEHKLTASLPSLRKMSKADLVSMLSRL